MGIESIPAEAVGRATGGCGLIFSKSTNSSIHSRAAVCSCYQQGVRYGNPEMVQIHPTAIPGEDKCRLISESVRGEGGRLWTPRNPDDTRKPLDIPENERWYFCEELDPVYGNLLSRDLVSFAIYCVCRMNKGVHQKQQVYLDITQLHRSRGGPYTRDQINDKLEGVLEIYEKFMREDPIETPMRIYPAVHYTMGGLWVDYNLNPDNSWNPDEPRNQMTNVPGLYAAGECEFQYHGANRLGANALLACLVGGEIASQGVIAYLREAKPSEVSESALRDAANQRSSEYLALKRSNGPENPYRLHAELADTMWNNCGIWRTQRDLLKAKDKLAELADRAHKCALVDDATWTNQAVPFTRALINMIEQSKAIVGGAIIRDESRGAHFKMDTPNRDDVHWLRTTLAHWKPSGPEFSFEQIDTRFIAPRARKYKINQNKIVLAIMGPDALHGVGAEQPKAEPVTAH